MNRVVFVDDESMVLDGLRRMLWSLRNSWDMVFHTSPLAALADIQSHGADVVVTDINMLEMSGLELLEAVRTAAPEAVRIILSGNTDAKSFFKSSSVAHQYLSKPCDHNELRVVVVRSLRLREKLKDSALRRHLISEGSLPSIPAIYEEAMRIIRDPKSSAKDLAVILEKDPACSAKLLQIVNSAYVGQRQEVYSVLRACILLGMENVKNLLLMIELFKPLLQRDLPPHFSLDFLWSHSLKVAEYCRMIAEIESEDRVTHDAVFCAGVLHEIGQIILATRLPVLYEQAAKHAIKNEGLLIGSERELFKSDHDEVGGFALELWGLPERIVEAITYHNNPYVEENRRISDTTILHVANYFATDAANSSMGAKLDAHYLEELGVVDRVDAWYDACFAGKDG